MVELAHGHLPRSIAFASALTAGWHDVPAVGQLVVWAVYDALGGERGLLAGQVLAARCRADGIDLPKVEERGGWRKTNLTWRLALAPVYIDSELGFVHGLGPNTDYAIGLAGGGFLLAGLLGRPRVWRI